MYLGVYLSKMTSVDVQECFVMFSDKYFWQRRPMWNLHWKSMA